LSKNSKIKIYKTLILPFVLYGCETWSPTQKEEHRLRVFENRVLRRIFGPVREEVAGACRRVDIVELNNLYILVESRWMRCVGHVAFMGEMRNAYKIFIRKHERKRPHGRARHRWEVNISMDLREMGCKMWTGFIWLRIGSNDRLW
jgi:hypothetical protein